MAPCLPKGSLSSKLLESLETNYVYNTNVLFSRQISLYPKSLWRLAKDDPPLATPDHSLSELTSRPHHPIGLHLLPSICGTPSQSSHFVEANASIKWRPSKVKSHMLSVNDGTVLRVRLHPLGFHCLHRLVIGVHRSWNEQTHAQDDGQGQLL